MPTFEGDVRGFRPLTLKNEKVERPTSAAGVRTPFALLVVELAVPLSKDIEFGLVQPVAGFEGSSELSFSSGTLLSVLPVPLKSLFPWIRGSPLKNNLCYFQRVGFSLCLFFERSVVV